MDEKLQSASFHVYPGGVQEKSHRRHAGFLAGFFSGSAAATWLAAEFSAPLGFFLGQLCWLLGLQTLELKA